MRVSSEQCRCGHDLSRLAIAALNDLMLEPGFLDSSARGGVADRLDRRNLGFANAVD
jgi:hypothetical protein